MITLGQMDSISRLTKELLAAVEEQASYPWTIWG